MAPHPAPAVALLRLRASAAYRAEDRLLARFCAIPERWDNLRLRMWAWRNYEAARAHTARVTAALFAAPVTEAA